MTFSRKLSNSSFTYSLSSNHVTTASSYKYLGIHLNRNLSWSTHINKITAKASRTLGYLKRNLHGAPSDTRKLAYQTFVRPQLEFASPIWSPHQAYLARNLESIQNRAARFIARDYNRHSSVTKIKLSLSLESLESRRTVALLCLFHKMIFSLHSHTLPLSRPCRTSHRLHNHSSFTRIFGHTKAFNMSALPRAINYWNSLPDDATNTRNPATFRDKITAIFA